MNVPAVTWSLLVFSRTFASVERVVSEIVESSSCGNSSWFSVESEYCGRLAALRVSAKILVPIQ